MEDKVKFITDDGEEVMFEVIEQARIGGFDYLLVTEDYENSDEAYILKKLTDDNDEIVYVMPDDDIELDAGLYQWRKDGLIRKNASRLWSDDWDSIEVKYTAGYDTAAVPDLIEAVCSITMGVLSVTAGVMSESADGVSISYNNSASSVAASLTTARKSALEPYKVVSSHAA